MEMDFDKLMAQREEDNQAKTTESGQPNHRQAVRKTAHLMEIQDSHGNSTITSAKEFMDTQEDQGFYYTADEEVKIGEDCHNVHIFMTDKIQKKGTVLG